MVFRAAGVVERVLFCGLSGGFCGRLSGRFCGRFGGEILGNFLLSGGDGAHVRLHDVK